MQIQNSNINFQGTPLKYQKLEHIVRNVNNQYPRVSPYRVNMRFASRPLSEHTRNWISKIGEIVDSNRQKISHRDYVEVLKNDIENVKASRLGDCGESSAITLAALIANGFKNFKIGLLLYDIDIREIGQQEILAKRTYNTTHEFVVLDTEEKSKKNKKVHKNSVIMDAWLGFCGNKSEAFKIFRQTFMNGAKKIQSTQGYEYTYKPRIALLDLNINVTKELSKYFAKNYPELVVKEESENISEK